MIFCLCKVHEQNTTGMNKIMLDSFVNQHRVKYKLLTQTYNLSIKTDLYSAVCRKPIRGATW